MKYLILCLLASITFACKKDQNNIWVTYTMTQCSDPWQNDLYFKGDKEGALRQFLEKKDIEVIDLNIKLDSLCAKTVVCAACTCSSCLDATVLIPEDDFGKISKFKFVRKP
ncbi:MAG: hypothetical protein ACOYOA_00810 [Saprospiraceae bacterium]